MPRKLAYTAAEAAELVGCSKWSIYRAVREGDLPTVRFFGRRVLIPAQALEQAIATGGVFGDTGLRTCACGRPTTGEQCSECEARAAS